MVLRPRLIMILSFAQFDHNHLLQYDYSVLILGYPPNSLLANNYCLLPNTIFLEYILSHMFLQTNGEQLEEKYDAVKSIGIPSREGVYVFIYTDMEKASI
jgi:hypothetical protein